MESFRVGRRAGTSLAYAFTIARQPGGGLSITDVAKLSEDEQTLIFAHFGHPMRAVMGIGGEQHMRLLNPGTEIHFAEAVTHLPEPFALMAGEKK